MKNDRIYSKNLFRFLIFLTFFITYSCLPKKDNKINIFLLQKLFFNEDSSSSTSFNPTIVVDVGNGFEPQLKGVLAFKTDKKVDLEGILNIVENDNPSTLFSIDDSPENGYISVRKDNLKDRQIKIEENTKITYAIYNGTTTTQALEIGIPYIAKSQDGNLRNPHIGDIIENSENREKFITLLANISKDKGAAGYVIDDDNFKQLSANWAKIKQDVETPTVSLDDFVSKPEFNKVLTGKSNANALSDQNEIKTIKDKGQLLIKKQNRISNARGSASISNLSFDSKIRNMSYIKDMPEQLDQPEELEELENKTTKDAKGNVTVCTTKKYKAAPGYSELSILDPTSDVIWPGSLIKGETIMSGEYTPIIDTRAPLTISASLQQNDQVSQTIDSPSVSGFRTARNKILSGGGQAPLNISYTIEEVHSSKQMSIAIGANFNMKGPTRVAINGSFNFNKNSVKSRFMVKFIQKYYTIDIDIPAYPSLFFKDPNRVRTDSWGVSPMYTSSVIYGRMILVTVESEKEAQEVRVALDASFRNKVTKMGGGVSLDVRHKKTLSTSTMKAFIVGGSGNKQKGEVSNVTTIEGVMDLINSEIAYYDESGDKSSGKTNLNISAGAPIAYKLRYLKDNSIGNIVLSSEYKVRNCTTLKSKKRKFKLELKRIEVLDISSDGGDMEFDIKVEFRTYGLGANSVNDTPWKIVYKAYRYPSIDEGDSEYLSGKSLSFTFSKLNDIKEFKSSGFQIDANVRDWDRSSGNDIIEDRLDKITLQNLIDNPNFYFTHSSSEGRVRMYYSFSELEL